MFTTTTLRTKLFLPAAAAALLAFAGGTALATEGNGDPFSVRGQPQVFAFGAPRLDLGSEAYPSMLTQGAARPGQDVNHVTRERVPAYQHGFDVGSESYAAP